VGFQAGATRDCWAEDITVAQFIGVGIVGGRAQAPKGVVLSPSKGGGFHREEEAIGGALEPVAWSGVSPGGTVCI